MRKMGIGKNYVVAIVEDNSQTQQAQEITEFFTRFKYFGPIIKGTTVNEVLDKALEQEVKYCIVQSAGHIIKDYKFFTFIEKWMETQNFFITGHIMDKDKKNMNNKSGAHGYYGLHKQCMLVNLDYYKKFDKPVFGDKKSEDEFVVKAKRHAKDIHDDYTPLSLAPTEELTICTPLVDGWNFISKSLENDLTVFNFHPKIRETKQYIYPSTSAEELQNQLSWINNIVAYAQDCVFFWNTENYADLKYVPLKEPINKLYSVAASFKPNMILNTFGFHEGTEVVFYDYSKQALAFKKLLLTEWDGSDYPAFLDWAVRRYRINETGGNETQDKNRQQLWEREISWWGSEKEIEEHWYRYKKLKHSYLLCDVCESPEKLTSKITNEPNSVIWWSNAFHTVNAQYVRGISGVRQCYETWCNQISEKNPNIWILGKDYYDKPVEGTIIKEYLDAYNS